MACLASPIATVGPDASRSSSSSVAVSSSSSATASWIRPHCAASDPLTCSPSSSIRLALLTPASRGSSQVAPESGVNPRSMNGSHTVASDVATVKSAASATLAPSPTAHPRNRHTTGS